MPERHLRCRVPQFQGGQLHRYNFRRAHVVYKSHKGPNEIVLSVGMFHSERIILVHECAIRNRQLCLCTGWISIKENGLSFWSWYIGQGMQIDS